VSTKPSTPPSALTLEIAKILRGEVARQNMTRTEFAAKVETLSRPQVSKILDGLKPIDIEDLDRLVFVLGLDMKKLIAEADRMTQGRHLPPDEQLL
jgi:transcriptional regulator with XRE-family HTH domain